jgi:hypothetical protein
MSSPSLEDLASPSEALTRSGAVVRVDFLMGPGGRLSGKLAFVVALSATGRQALAQEHPVDTCPGCESPAVSEEPAVVADPAFRRLRLRADGGVGVARPEDVNAYIKSKMPTDSYDRVDYSETILLLSTGVALAYYPAPFLGLRPGVIYLYGVRIQRLEPGLSETFSMHSIAPGLSVDIAFDTGRMARYFVSPGVSYHLAWFEGFSARGLGLSLALGTELSFGQARKSGVSIALVLRSAKLPTTDGPLSRVPMRHLDFTSAIVCVGFQTGFLQ